MDVFISWSGNRSKAVAQLLNEWIQCVLQAARPWMSTEMDRGSVWFTELTNQLQDSTIGIVCLTQDNLDKPWILFEAGALAKGLTSSQVCTFLVDLEPTDVSDPLAQFNHTLPKKGDIYSLILTLNKSLGEDALEGKILDKVFDTYWPQFESGFKTALENNPSGAHPPERSEEDLLSEVLRGVRAMNKRIQLLESASNSLNGLPTQITLPEHIEDFSPSAKEYVEAKHRLENIGLTEQRRNIVASSALATKRAIDAMRDLNIVSRYENKKERLSDIDNVDDVDESKIDG